MSRTVAGCAWAFPLGGGIGGIVLLLLYSALTGQTRSTW